MTPNLTVEAIIFGIHSAIKLGKAMRKAYANSLKSRRIALPLPDFSADIKETTIEEFFNSEKPNGGKQFIGKIERLDFLHDKSELSNLSAEELEEYIDYYKAFFQITNGRIDELAVDDVVNLMRIRQWEQGKNPNPSPLQTIAGTLVEIGIDFFNQVPGAVNSNSVKGQYLSAFLKAMDDIDFSDSDGAELKKSIFKELVPKLFITTAELTAELSDELVKDEKFQDFIKITSQGLAEDLTSRLEKIGTAGNQEEVMRWGQWIFSSMVKNAGNYVFNDPAGIFGFKAADSAEEKKMQAAKIKLIKSTGLAVMAAILDEKENLQLKAAFNVQTLDSVVKAALETVAEYPELISKRDGVREIVRDTAKAFADSGIQRPDLLPELVRLILENTAENLDLLWDVDADDAEHLLVTATRQILAAISAKKANGEWRPSMTKAQMLALVEDLLEEVIHNPQWVAKGSADDSLLTEVITTVFACLEKLPKAQRLKVDTIHLIIQVSLNTVANSQKVLDKLNWGTDAQEVSVLNAALDLILACVYRQKTVIDKVVLLHELLDYILEILIAQHPDRKGLVLTQFILHESAGVIQNGGFDEDYAHELAEAALEVIAEHPDLLVKGEGLQNILAGVASALADAGIDRPDLLPEFVRLVLEHSAGNVHLIVKTTNQQPKYLLVLALKELLTALASKSGDSTWQPQLSYEQMLAICNSIFEEFLLHPDWLTAGEDEDSIFKQVLEAIFAALRQMPPAERLSPETLEALIQMSLRIALTNQKVLDKLKWGSDLEEKTLLNKVLDLVFGHIFESGKYTDREALLYDLLDYIFEMILSSHGDQNGFVVILILLGEELDIDFSDGIDIPSVNEIVEACLQILQEHPEMVSGKEGIQNIVAGVAAALKAAGLKQPHILSETIRLILEHTAGNLSILIDTSKRKDKHILVIALKQTLKALSARPSGGKWKPKLTENQILEIIELVAREVVDNPEWVKDEHLRITIIAILKSLENITTAKKPHPETLKILIEKCLDAVNFRKTLIINMIQADGGEEKLVLTYTLDGLFFTLYDKNNQNAGTWTLTQKHIINAIIDHFLLGVAGEPSKAAIDASVQRIKQAVEDLKSDKKFVLEDLLEELVE